MAGRMFDRLSDRFGEKSVFMDIDTIPIGAANYKETIREALGNVDVLLVVVGSRWLENGARGVPRITEADDVLRFEIETALEQGISVVPVVVEGGRMPAAGELPDSISRFAFHNAAEVSSGRDFRLHMDRLIGVIEKMPDRRRKKPLPVPPDGRSARQYWLELGAYVVVASVLVVVSYFVVGLEASAVRTALHMAISMAICGVVAVMALRSHQLGGVAAMVLGAVIGAIGIFVPWFVNDQGNFAGWPFLTVPMANSVLGFIAACAVAAFAANLGAQARSPEPKVGMVAGVGASSSRFLAISALIAFAVSIYLGYVAWQPYCLGFNLAAFCWPSE
jgi:hypothetical protein